MSKIEFDVGARVRFNERASMNKGLEGTVVSPLAGKLLKFGGRMEALRVYCVLMDNGKIHDVVPAVIEPAPPRSRGDLDRKVAWTTLPDSVVLAMKGAADGVA